MASPGIADKRAVRQVRETSWSLVEPFSIDEVNRALSGMKDSAAGPDRLTLGDIKAMSRGNVTAYLTAILAVAHMPEAFENSRVTLVPKGSETPKTSTDLRPITVSSIMARLLNKLIASRWSNAIRLPSEQLAFTKCDGTFEATILLDTLLKEASKKFDNLAMASLNVSKAFDSVSHDKLIRSANSFGAPPALVALIMSQYDNATSMIGSYKVATKRGVKQGDPLSPLLFIMCMDEILHDANFEVGVPLVEIVIDAIAYADDLVLLAPNRCHLAGKMGIFAESLRMAGMEINEGKSFAMIITANKKEK